MASGIYTALLSSVALLLISFNSANSQQLKTVLVGEAVEFSCSLSESLPPGDISWQIQWDDYETPVTVNAEATDDVSGPEFISTHGDFRTVYESSRGFRFTHHATLIIENVQLIDAGQYHCKHEGTFRDRGIFSEHELRVLPRPPDGERPVCSYTILSGSRTSPSPSFGDTIELSCQFTGGNPPARLVWYKQGLQIGRIVENSNVMEYQLQPSDNGMEFSCHAMSPALSETSYCHLTPFEIQPSATLTPSQARTRIGGDVTFTCIGQGVPSVTGIEWRIDGVVQRRSREDQIILTDLSVSRSELRLQNLQVVDNGTDIMCEVSVASGMTADSLATVMIIPDYVTTSSPPILVTDRATTTARTASQSPGSSSKIITTQAGLAAISKSPKSSVINSRPTTSKMTTHKKRVVIIDPEPKLDQSNQQPPSTTNKSNIPTIATAITILCLVVLVIIFVVVVKRRNKRNSHKVLQPVPSSPTDSFPDPLRNPMIEYENRMYEGTIIRSTQNKTEDNFYQTLPLDGHNEDPEHTWNPVSPATGPRDSMDHEGCGIWTETKNPHYENTAIGRPFPTFVRQQEPEHFLYDHVERKGDSTI